MPSTFGGDYEQLYLNEDGLFANAFAAEWMAKAWRRYGGIDGWYIPECFFGGAL